MLSIFSAKFPSRNFGEEEGKEKRAICPVCETAPIHELECEAFPPRTYRVIKGENGTKGSAQRKTPRVTNTFHHSNEWGEKMRGNDNVYEIERRNLLFFSPRTEAAFPVMDVTSRLSTAGIGGGFVSSPSSHNKMPGNIPPQESSHLAAPLSIGRERKKDKKVFVLWPCFFRYFKLLSQQEMGAGFVTSREHKTLHSCRFLKKPGRRNYIKYIFLYSCSCSWCVLLILLQEKLQPDVKDLGTTSKNIFLLIPESSKALSYSLRFPTKLVRMPQKKTFF